MKENAPLAVFVYNRPVHTEQVLSALNDNIGAEATDLFLFADAAAKPEAEESVKEVRELIHAFADRSNFRSVTIREADRNIGCRDSIIGGVSSVMDRYGKVIVVEDDLLTRKNFLKYMNEGLNLYEKDNRIWSLAGHTRQFPELSDYPFDFYLTRRACSWGWGMWKDRWDLIDWQVSDYESFRKNPFQRLRFARGGGDLYKMLENEMNGKSSAWDLRLQYSMAKTDRYTVYPKRTFVYNIGFDGSGTHCVVTGNETFENLEAQDYTLVPNLQPNARINRGFLNAEYPNLYKRGVRKLKKVLNLSS
ncbi:MAG: hypothetical protein IKD66_11840 [Solobacterium sp.]|nr:hypothetical protein [Solobacterium sp.]